MKVKDRVLAPSGRWERICPPTSIVPSRSYTPAAPLCSRTEWQKPPPAVSGSIFAAPKVTRNDGGVECFAIHMINVYMGTL